LQLGCSAVGFAGELLLPTRQCLGPLGPVLRAGQLATQPGPVALQPVQFSGGGGVGGRGLL
jgi:hypothetical protein